MASEPQIYGDVARQAISSLKGYAYQLYQSALAWISLKEDEYLFLEIAEDYAVTAESALTAVQIKNSAASITLNSPEVIETINSFFQLIKSNPDKSVSLKHLTTAKIGLEKKIEDRVNNTPGLEYWGAIRNDADVEPLRNRLLKLDLSAEAKQFLTSKNFAEIRHGLIDRIEWLSGSSDLEAVRRTISNALVYLGEKKGVSSFVCDRMVDPIISHILTKAFSRGTRRLERADFVRFFDEASRISLPVSAIDGLLNSVIPAQNIDSQSFVSSVSVLRPVATIDLLRFSKRTALVEQIQTVLSEHKFIWLYGVTGTGKSSLSRMIAQQASGGWYSLQLRSLGQRETAEALYRASSQIALDRPIAVVLDDLERLTNSVSKDAFTNLIQTAHRNSTAILITSNSKPASGLLATLGMPENAGLKIGNLTEDEVVELVTANGADPDKWTRYIYSVTSAGHPLLVDAFIRNLKRRIWPIEELQKLASMFGNNEEVEEVKAEARKRLFLELDTDESELLLRLSLILGTFDRDIALFLAELDPVASMPGKSFENLLGAWIETESEGRYRLSSLVSNAGTKTLGSAATEKIHHELAGFYVKEKQLNANRFDDIILHGLAGKNDEALTAASIAVISANADDLELIAQYASNLGMFRTDVPLYAANPNVSKFLRMAQVLILVSSKKPKKFQEAVAAFARENFAKNNEPTIALTNAMLHIKLLSATGLVNVIEDLPKFTLKTAAYSKKADVPFSDTNTKTMGSVSSIDEYVQFMFAFQISKVPSFETLKNVLLSLISKSKPEREFLLKAFEGEHFEKALVVKLPWTRAIDDGTVIDEKMAKSYMSLGKELSDGGDQDFAIAAFETAAVIWDEELKNTQKAKKCLKEASDRFGESKVISKALSRILFHEKNYLGQLEIGMPIAKTFEGRPTEKAYFFRELAIGNSRLGKHVDAKRLYLDAYTQLTTKKENVSPMAAGLLADAAVEAHWLGNNVDSVKLFSEALLAGEKLDPTNGLHSTAVPRLVAHSIVWLMYQVTGRISEAGEHEMVSGANSNPNPHEDLQGPAEVSIDFIWYVLSEIECALDEECGIVNFTLSPERDAKAALASELGLYRSAAQSAERRLSASHYLKFTPRALDANLYYASNGANLLQTTLATTPRQRLPEVGLYEFLKYRDQFFKSLFAFALRSAFINSPESAEDFVKQCHSQTRPLISSEVLEAFLKGEPSVAGTEKALAGTVGCVIKNLTAYRPIHATDLLVVSLRLLELLEGQFSEAQSVENVIKWLRHRWRATIVGQAFQLSTPQLALQAFEEFEEHCGNRIQDIADLILTLERFVNLNFGSEYLEWLAKIKAR